jgi:hypothetical protein
MKWNETKFKHHKIATEKTTLTQCGMKNMDTRITNMADNKKWRSYRERLGSYLHKK